MSVEQLVQIIWAVSAFLSVVFILLHSPKGDGLGGIGGQSQMFTSTKRIWQIETCSCFGC